METDSINKIICNGGLIISKSTKRFLFLLRTQGKTAGTWGFVGGKKEPIDETAIDTLQREINEELGNTPRIIKTIPLELFLSKDQKFQYNTYALIVDNEFIPKLNIEHAGYCWVEYDRWPNPLHKGIKNSFNNKIIKAKLELLLELI